MDRDLKVGIVVVIALAAAIAIIPFYFALTSPQVDVTGFQVISANQGISANAYKLQGFVHIGENLTVYINVSPNWPVLIKNITVATAGFTLVSVNASLPLLVDQNITLPVIIKSSQPYLGQVIFYLGGMNASDLGEKILVPDIVADTSSKTVVFLSVQNAGDVPLSNSTAYLVRSDGLVVNSTPLPTAGQPPHNITYFDINMSYSQATLIEVYYVRVETAGGATATSRPIALTCNC